MAFNPRRDFVSPHSALYAILTRWRHILTSHSDGPDRRTLSPQPTDWPRGRRRWICHDPRSRCPTVSVVEDPEASSTQQRISVEKLQRMLQAVGLETHAAYSKAWAYLGFMGALRLSGKHRVEQLYGPSRRRLLFHIADAEVAKTW